ncbi:MULTISPECIES: hypothetical protein [unclassified Clostridium]|uniref:hypothetical protein n=1 Tax=unclassified Clostridium TaxID=2614128 RepID=UPI00029753FE|nr:MULTISPECIES: hypothetical protein [unclassified Clostridium]EKQ55893.1 MAG: hypothetical protein A370_02466 [Clostridium sp. Maddingley MBC34-26]
MAVKKIVSGSVKSQAINDGVIGALKKVNNAFKDGENLKAKVISIEGISPVSTGMGVVPRVKLEFDVFMDDGSLRKLVQRFLLIEHPKQPFYQLMMVTVGKIENVNINNIIGKEVGIEIKNSKTENGTYSNIESIFSVDELENDCNDNVEVVDSDGNIEEYDY